MLPDICDRLERYYDELLVDEVQDFAGNDFNFLLALCVGRNYQSFLPVILSAYL